MSFMDDVDACVSATGMPKPSVVFGSASIGQMIKISNAILAAAKTLGVSVTFADLAAAAGATALAGEAAEVVAQLAAMAGTLVISVYLGACLTCVGKVAIGAGLTAEIDNAEDGDAKAIALQPPADPSDAVA